MKWKHIFPRNDKKFHNTYTENNDCECNPSIDWEDMLIIHNAGDYREVIEQATEIIEELIDV